MQAIQLVFKYLPIAYEHPGDEEARSMMHSAACIAALAFSNASVGVNHALAHVIAYNASIPVKFMPSPNQKGYLAHKKYAAMADLLGLGGYMIDEKVKKTGDSDRTVARSIGDAAFDRAVGHFAGRVRAGHAGLG